jgi:hypothetical protein
MRLVESRGMGLAVRRSFLIISAVTAVGLTLAGCSDKAPGEPHAATSVTTPPNGNSGGPFPTGTSGSTRTSSSQPVSANSPLKDVKACSLLSSSEVTTLGAGAGREETINNGRACRFTGVSSFVTSVVIYDELGLDDVTTDTSVTPVPTVGKHKAVQWTGGVDTCVISLEVAKNTRVDAQGTAGGDTQKSCSIALQVAKFVEPKLPAT